MPDMTGRIGTNHTDGMVYSRVRSISGDIDWKDDAIFSSHWHYDLEFIYFENCERDYFINGANIHLNKGQALFINSCRLHRTNSAPADGDRFIPVRINPQLIVQCTKYGRELCDRKFGLPNPDYLVFDPSDLRGKEIIRLISSLPALVDNRVSRPLLPVAAALQLISLVASCLPDSEITVNRGGQDQMIYLFMLEYINNNYNHKIHTEDLAEAGHTSRAKVFRLFERFAGMTPNEYIIDYRLSKSIELLRDTELSILDISDMCGFNTPSYFTSVFRKEKGVTPREFRLTLK